jgi:hypothetical protein
MKAGKLRIAWTIIWTAIILLVIGFWIRSYFGRVTFEVLITPTQRYYLYSLSGSIVLDWEERIFLGIELQRAYDPSYFMQLTTNAGIRIVRFEGRAYAISVSYWLLTLPTAFIAAMPWLRFRFSLRTLLITTTAAALLLWLVISAARR